MKGDHFVLIRTDEGRYRWELWGRHHPTGPIAQGGRDYSSPTTAKSAMGSARTAMLAAVDESGDLRIARRDRE